MSDQLSVVLIQLDSLNRHFLPCYGNDWVQAPNLYAFAQRSAVFDRHYVGSLPCMPARREICAGTEEWWWRGWGPLEPWDQPLAYLAARQGAVTQLITDHYHLWEWGSHSYPYDYAGCLFIRGHEYDNWRTDPVREVPPWAEQMVARMGDTAQIYLRNVQDFRCEDDFFAPRVMTGTAQWLDRNRNQEHFFCMSIVSTCTSRFMFPNRTARCTPPTTTGATARGRAMAASTKVLLRLMRTK
jgi:arylsulfatase A-like enzyme